jgi:magnesium-transporting ATPase (P-type)
VDAFEYLSVLISIVLGLALTQLLTSSARLVQARGRVRPYWVVLVWIGALLAVLVQSWWAMFDLRDHQNWNLLQFALVLAHPTLLYFMTVLLLPDADADGAIDLRANYFAQAPWFFCAMAGVIVVSLLRPVVMDGGFPLDADRIFQLVLLAGVAVAASTRRPALHAAIALTAPVALALYIGALFFQLH